MVKKITISSDKKINKKLGKKSDTIWPVVKLKNINKKNKSKSCS